MDEVAAMTPREVLACYRGRRIMVTGHTGFKGSWLCSILELAGAQVVGYALEPPTDPNLFRINNAWKAVESVIGDVRNGSALADVMVRFSPEIVIHMAAQPLVRESYIDPVGTYETNVMGTVHVLEAVRGCSSVRSVLNVTTDKVYLNHEWSWGYREDDVLDGCDPYSNSKSCSELVTHSYTGSFLEESGIAVSTARAGNVIGGGDFSRDRIVPDCVRAALGGAPITIRNPRSTRPYQHVLEPLFAYLLIAISQMDNLAFSGAYNIGPGDEGCTTTEDVVRMFGDAWGEGFSWQVRPDGGPREANFLKLDCSKIRSIFGWIPVCDIERAIEETVAWTRAWVEGCDMGPFMRKQVESYMADAEER